MEIKPLVIKPPRALPKQKKVNPYIISRETIEDVTITAYSVAVKRITYRVTYRFREEPSLKGVWVANLYDETLSKATKKYCEGAAREDLFRQARRNLRSLTKILTRLDKAERR